MDRVSLPLLYQLVTAQTTHVISSGCVDVPATPLTPPHYRVDSNESHFVHVDESRGVVQEEGLLQRKTPPPPPPPPPILG